MTLVVDRGQAWVDPTPGDWYNRTLAHLERGDQVKALLCFEQILAQQPGDREVQERVRDLRTVIEGPAQERYEQLKCAIAAEHARWDAVAQVTVFNRPALLGLESGQPGDKKR